MDNPLQAVFDTFVHATQDWLTIQTARVLAEEIGVHFDPSRYDVG